MSFIGQDQRPAPKIKEAMLTPEELASAYHQTIEVSGMLLLVGTQQCVWIRARLTERKHGINCTIKLWMYMYIEIMCIQAGS